jgi:hypothetical protein
MKRNFFTMVAAALIACGNFAADAAEAVVNTAGALTMKAAHGIKTFAYQCGERLNDAIFAYMARNGLVQTLAPLPFNPGDMQRYRVTDPNQSTQVWQPLYDFQLYPLAGQQEFLFFQNGVGSGKTTAPGAVAGSAKTFADTNMQSNGSLPSGNEFLAQAIEVYFFPGSVTTADTYTPAKLTTDATAALLAASVSAVNDVSQFYNEGLFEFRVLDNVLLRETCLRNFPPSTWIELDSAVATTNATLSLAAFNARPKGDPYFLSTPISLQPTVNFSVKISYPAARALPSGFNARMGIKLWGHMLRASQ